MKNIKRVLFVCSGNSCRSVMAENYLKKLLKNSGITMDVQSAGTLGVEGLEATQETLTVLKEEGIRAASHRSKAVTADFIKWADLVLVMEPLHRSKLIAIMPEAEGKIKYLAEFNADDSSKAIPDPIGRPLSFYEETFEYIKKSLEGFVKWLKE